MWIVRKLLPSGAWLCVLLWLLVAPHAGAETVPVRIGLTPVFLDEQLSFLKQWQQYLEDRTGRPVIFVQRQSYREVTELLLNGELDAAWLCGYPYVQHREQLQPLAVPLFHGKPLYQAYLIVAAADGHTASLDELKGKTFAFSDPDSNSGFLVVQAGLRARGLDAKNFFRRSFYTWSHRNVVRAVAEGLADGGTVDGYVWEALAKTNPELTGRTRVVSRSGFYGFPPFVTRLNGGDSSQLIADALFNMSRDPRGQVLLRQLSLDGFTEPPPGLYQSIAKLAEQLQ